MAINFLPANKSMENQSRANFREIKDRGEWQGLLSQALFQTFFSQVEWEDFLVKQFKWLSFEHYQYKDELLLSLAKVGRSDNARFVSYPFGEYGGFLPQKNNLNIERFAQEMLSCFGEARVKLHPALWQFCSAPSPKADWLRPNLRSFWLEGLDKKSQAEVFSSFRKTLRHSIIKSQSNGLVWRECSSEKELNDFYRLYIKTTKRKATVAFPYDFFVHFYQNNNRVKIVLVFFQDKLINGAVFLFYDKFVHYFIGANDEHYQRLGGNYLLLWQEIKNNLSKDIEVFDFGASAPGSSLEVFKSGWGGAFQEIYEITNSPQSSISHSKTARKLWGLLPGRAIECLSPYLIKFTL